MDQSVYTRPKKPIAKTIARMRRFSISECGGRNHNLSVDKSTECHVTPPEVASRMFEYALSFGFKETDRWADPQCGTGNLIQAMLNGGVCPDKIVAVERHIGLANYCYERFDRAVEVTQGCFLTCHSTMGKVDVVMTNPPFKSVKKHMAAAQILGKGLIIGLVPVTFDWPGMIELEKLPKGTFSTTQILTKIIAIKS